MLCKWSGRRDCPSQTLLCLLTTYGAHRLIADRHTLVCLSLVVEHASPCSNRRPKNNIKKHHLKRWRFFILVGATRFEHATSWSQTKRSTRLSYTPSTKAIFTLYFLFCKHYFLRGDFFFLSSESSIIRPSSPRLFLGLIKPCARKLYTPSLATIK